MVGPAGTANVRLVIDTGAALTTITPTIAQSVGYSSITSIAPTSVRTATGIEKGYAVRLLELIAIGVSNSNVPVNVADLGHDLDGVLGMNVLLDFNIEIRPAERMIYVEPIAGA